jgi:leucyl/phenylalanyl-tRNA--protein transferase
VGQAGQTLIGGVYGLALGGAFFGESMFSRRRDASKVALAHLVQRLRAGGFTLFDIQFLTPHLARLGAVEIGRAAYRPGWRRRCGCRPISGRRRTTVILNERWSQPDSSAPAAVRQPSTHRS